MAEQYREAIRNFLAQHRIAVIGVNRNPRGFSATVFRELVKRGYDAVPVNPKAADIGGVRCFARAQDIDPRPDAAMVIVPAEAVELAVSDCAKAGIPRVWLFGVSGPRGVNARALELCREHGTEVVPGYCPFMFLPDTAWFHRAHGWFARLTGSYPK